MRPTIIMIALLFLAGGALAGTIGVYANSDGTGCALTVPAGLPATVYVVAHTFPTDPDGGTFASGEFRLIGLPASWVATPLADPGVHIWFGDPFAEGWRFAFASLQAGTVPLLAILLLATTNESNVRFDVVQHLAPQPPFGGTVDCPWVQYCDVPCDNGATCVEGVSFFINSGGCGLGVEESSWSEIRALYR